jgi:hypothetical protein
MNENERWCASRSEAEQKSQVCGFYILGCHSDQLQVPRYQRREGTEIKPIIENFPLAVGEIATLVAAREYPLFG